MSAKLLRITGSVQGVFFRVNAKEQADMLKLTGWVRNDDDGSVEALVQGDEVAVKNFIGWCHKGPPAAEVESVTVQDTEEQDVGMFSILR